VAEPVRKVRRKTAAAPPKRQLLNEGDLIEFSVTVEVTNTRNQKFWFKGGGTTQVQPGETGEEARDRLEQFVTEGVDANVLAVVNG
jgi:broad specificity phosphatase PhoE